jgi:hypothetical protein
MWRNVFGHALYQAIAIFTILFAGQYIGLAEPYEVACNKYVEAQGETPAYCAEYNPFYAKGFYIEEKDLKFWESRKTLDENAKDG